MSHRVRVLILKEWREVFRGSKTIWIGTVGIPVFLLGFFLYFIMLQVRDLNDPTIEDYRYLVEALVNVSLVYFIMFPMIIPQSIAVYAIIGEKENKSLEPLLATPLTTLELFVGKVLASIIPAIAATWVIFGLFWLLLGALISHAAIMLVWEEFGLVWMVTIYLFTPLASIFATTVSMAIATRVSDLRSAQFLSSFVILPIVVSALYFAFQRALASLALMNMLALVILLMDVALLGLNVKLFQREEILTRWR